MPTALEVGLVPGFALQDGDKLAQLIGGGGAGGGFGLGNTTNGNANVGSSGNASATGAFQIAASVTVVMNATATNNSIQLTNIAPSSMLRIYNETAQLLYIFPPSGQSVDIDTGNPVPVGDAVTLNGGARCDYLYLGSNQWISDLLGSSSQ